MFAHKTLRACASSKQQTGFRFHKAVQARPAADRQQWSEKRDGGNFWHRGGRLTRGWFGHMAYH